MPPRRTDRPEMSGGRAARKRDLKRGGKWESEVLQEDIKVEDALFDLGQILNIIQKESKPNKGQ
jgi:hypothetical protein